MSLRATYRAVSTLAASALLATPALAAEAAEHGAAAGHGAAGEHASAKFLGLPYEVFWTLNLVVFLGLLAKFAGPAVVKLLEGKQRDLAHALAEADRQRQEAAGMEQRLAAQIAELRHEVDELAARAEREGQREREEILAEAQRESARIETAARAEIAQGLQQAKLQLTAHAAKLATELAEQRLATGLTREDKKRLFRDNLARLEKKQGGN
ncbi:MAG TPA: F0F1 ATP synthase subunit B [Thermoanaerobaculia bacterium]|nr:F0F1 ATP synthase subunit B [Thermoanaerobaculia bacterium]